jgi:hypothetical protein
MDAGSQRDFLLQVKEHIAIIPTVPIGKAETLTMYGYKHNELTKTGYWEHTSNLLYSGPVHFAGDFNTRFFT